MPERLSAIDGSFLRVETRNAHMHVAWSATFRRPPAGPRPTLERLRRSIAGRLEHVPLFRRRLAYPPPGMGEPFWVDDPDFEVGRHVLMLGMPNTEIDDLRFALLCDGVLSAPLPRDRPLPLRILNASPGQRPAKRPNRRARGYSPGLTWPFPLACSAARSAILIR